MPTQIVGMSNARRLFPTQMAKFILCNVQEAMVSAPFRVGAWKYGDSFKNKWSKGLDDANKNRWHLKYQKTFTSR